MMNFTAKWRWAANISKLLNHGNIYQIDSKQPEMADLPENWIQLYNSKCLSLNGIQHSLYGFLCEKNSEYS